MLLRSKLLAEREKRIRPGLDDKVLADWNGMLIAALVRAANVWGRPDWLELAQSAFHFVANDMARGARLGHSWREGRLLLPGLASDYAHMIRAALALAQTTGEPGFIQHAIRWQQVLEGHHTNPDGSYYLTADDAEALIVRPTGTTDDATPNHNAVIAQNLVRLAVLTGDDAYRERADRLLAALVPAAAANPFGHAAILNAIDLRIRTIEVVVTGQGVEQEALAAATLKLPQLNTVLFRASSATSLPAHHPAQAKLLAVSNPAAFVCVGQTCSLPVTRPEDLRSLIGDMTAVGA